MIRAVAWVILASAAAEACALQVDDDRGITISLRSAAERIVALAPHLAEMAFAGGAGAKLVGVSSVSRYPAEAQRLPVVATAGRVDIERVIALRPDLVLAWQSGNSPLQIDRLERVGIQVFVTEVRTLSDIPRIVRAVGALAGSGDVAKARAGDFVREIGTLRQHYANRRRVTVFLEIWHQPLLTVSGAHLISDALHSCSGRNVFARVKTLTPLVSREQILGARPEAIVTEGVGSESPQAWRGLEAVPAVRDRRIYAIDPYLLHGQGPHLLAGVRALCERLELARN